MKLTRSVVILETKSDTVLDYNYNYEAMKEIYRALEISNPDLALKTHNEGYKIENKIYKLFTHHLFIESADYTKEGIVIKKGTKCKLTVSGTQEIVKNIVFGLMEKGTFNLFDSKFAVLSVEKDKKFKFNNITLYKVRNPIVATKQDENRRIIFKSPYEEDYYEVLANNLKRKYKLVHGKEYEGELYFDIEDTFSIKRRLISNLKGNIIIGYSDFELYLVADKDMQEVAYYCGLGSNNSLGMGMVTFITSRRD